MRSVVPGWCARILFFAVLVFVWASLMLGTAAAQQGSNGSMFQKSPQAQDLLQNVKDLYFPFNIYNRIINPNDAQADGAWLSQHAGSPVWIQGYADIRGDIFYNLVLSYRRAQFVKSQLVKSGVDESRIQFATGWGKLYPVCQSDDEQCYQQQRRVDIVPPDAM
ncbi:MAG TPA: OmpA family protein [Terriglobales bacterium]|nr:OmpA family protein [Terriglobales bacterium]